MAVLIFTAELMLTVKLIEVGNLLAHMRMLR